MKLEKNAGESLSQSTAQNTTQAFTLLCVNFSCLHFPSVRRDEDYGVNRAALSEMLMIYGVRKSDFAQMAVSSLLTVNSA
jgi:hypothetical protein